MAPFTEEEKSSIEEMISCIEDVPTSIKDAVSFTKVAPTSIEDAASSIQVNAILFNKEPFLAILRTQRLNFGQNRKRGRLIS